MAVGRARRAPLVREKSEVSTGAAAAVVDNFAGVVVGMALCALPIRFFSRSRSRDLPTAETETDTDANTDADTEAAAVIDCWISFSFPFSLSLPFSFSLEFLLFFSLVSLVSLVLEGSGWVEEAVLQLWWWVVCGL